MTDASDTTDRVGSAIVVCRRLVIGGRRVALVLVEKPCGFLLSVERNQRNDRRKRQHRREHQVSVDDLHPSALLIPMHRRPTMCSRATSEAQGSHLPVGDAQHAVASISEFQQACRAVAGALLAGQRSKRIADQAHPESLEPTTMLRVDCLVVRQNAPPPRRSTPNIRARALALVPFAAICGVLAALATTRLTTQPTRLVARGAHTVTLPTRTVTITHTAQPPPVLTTYIAPSGLRTQILTGWRSTSQELGGRERTTLTGPQGTMILIDRTAHVSAPINGHGYSTISVLPWRSGAVHGVIWRFRASFCSNSCLDYLVSTAHAGYAVLATSQDTVTLTAALTAASGITD